MTTYCYQCGGKLSYPAKESPKFCNYCGVALAAQGPKGPKGPEGEPALDEESLAKEHCTIPEEEIIEIPNIDFLDFDIDVRGPQKMSFGEIIERSIQEGPAPSLGARARTRQSKTKVIKQIKKEGGTLRPPSKKK